MLMESLYLQHILLDFHQQQQTTESPTSFHLPSSLRSVITTLAGSDIKIKTGFTLPNLINFYKNIDDTYEMRVNVVLDDL